MIVRTVNVKDVIAVVPNKEAKYRKQLRRKKNEWLNKYGRTKKQIERWKRNHKGQSIELPRGW